MIDHIPLSPDDGEMHQWMQTLFPGKYGALEVFRDSACSWQIPAVFLSLPVTIIAVSTATRRPSNTVT